MEQVPLVCSPVTLRVEAAVATRNPFYRRSSMLTNRLPFEDYLSFFNLVVTSEEPLRHLDSAIEELTDVLLDNNGEIFTLAKIMNAATR